MREAQRTIATNVVIDACQAEQDAAQRCLMTVNSMQPGANIAAITLKVPGQCRISDRLPYI